MLKLQFVDGSRESIWLVEPSLRIGSNKENDLVLEEPNIKDIHAEIRLKDEQLYLLNKHPEYVVNVNGRRVKKAVKIGENDLLELGRFKFKVVSPTIEFAASRQAEDTQTHDEWGLQATASWASQSFYPIENTVSIGRDDDCDITVPVSHLSRKHAQLTISGSYMVVKDLGSTNGTFLNGERISQGRARPGDKLRFDVVNFTVTGPQSDLDQTIVRPAGILTAAPSKSKNTTTQQPPPPARKLEPANLKSSKVSDPDEAPKNQQQAKKANVLLYTIFGFILVFGGLSAFFWLR